MKQKDKQQNRGMIILSLLSILRCIDKSSFFAFSKKLQEVNSGEKEQSNNIKEEQSNIIKSNLVCSTNDNRKCKKDTKIICTNNKKDVVLEGISKIKWEENSLKR